MSFIALHIGAGNHSETNYPSYRSLMKEALKHGQRVLRNGGTAVEAVSATISVLEDCDLTNAGRGSSLTNKGTVECDAGIMNGATLQFGAVGAVSGVPNPITLAAKILEEQNKSVVGDLVPPSLLVGKGAREFAEERGIDTCDPRNLVSGRALAVHKHCTRHIRKLERRLEQKKIEEEKKIEEKITVGKLDKKLLVQGDSEAKVKKRKGEERGEERKSCNGTTGSHDLMKARLDTVGCVVVDAVGSVAAGVSSGGLILKTPGRVGQSAVFGAGCWAENNCQGSGSNVAVSSSGCGEQLVSSLLAVNAAKALADNTDPLDPQFAGKLRQIFLNSKFILSDKKIGGALMVRHDPLEGSTDLYCFHTTHSMAFAHMGARDTKPTIHFSTQDKEKEGVDMVLQFSSYYVGT